MFYKLIEILVLGYFLVIFALRYNKCVQPLRASEAVRLPGLPTPEGLIYRLDGTERKNRTIVLGRRIGVTKDGSIEIPREWEKEVTAGRLACVAHAWGLAMLAESEEDKVREREKSLARTTILTIFALVIVGAAWMLHHITLGTALAIAVGVWGVLSFMAVPTQHTDWRAKEIAQERLKKVGLWPQLSDDAVALEQCLNAMSWHRVAGFRRILPR